MFVDGLCVCFQRGGRRLRVELFVAMLRVRTVVEAAVGKWSAQPVCFGRTEIATHSEHPLGEAVSACGIRRVQAVRDL